MKSASKFAMILALITAFAAPAFASHAEGVMTSMMKARENLLALLDSTDKAAHAGFQAEIVKATKEVDSKVKSALADKATTKDELTKYKEFSEIWEAFKKTRDGEIIPAIKAGKIDAAKALAKGVQAERFGKMKALLASLGAK